MKIYLSETFKWDPIKEKVPVFCETDKPIKFGQLIKLGYSYYSVSIAPIENAEGTLDWVGVTPLDHFYKDPEELKQAEIEESWGKDKIHCPVCGYVNEDSWEVDESDDNYECPNCGSSLAVEVEYLKIFMVTCKSVNKDIVEL